MDIEYSISMDIHSCNHIDIKKSSFQANPPQLPPRRRSSTTTLMASVTSVAVLELNKPRRRAWSNDLAENHGFWIMMNHWFLADATAGEIPRVKTGISQKPCRSCPVSEDAEMKSVFSWARFYGSSQFISGWIAPEIPTFVWPLRGE